MNQAVNDSDPHKNLKETPEEYKKRWRTIRVVYFMMLFGSVGQLEFLYFSSSCIQHISELFTDCLQVTLVHSLEPGLESFPRLIPYAAQGLGEGGIPPWMCTHVGGYLSGPSLHICTIFNYILIGELNF